MFVYDIKVCYIKNVKNKRYYAPTASFLIFFVYLILGLFVFSIDFSTPWSVQKMNTYALVLAVFFYQIIRLSYYLEIRDGKICEKGYFTSGRSLLIDSIVRISWKKQNFWSGSYRDMSWQRQYYIHSDTCTLPLHSITKTLIKDIQLVRPDIVVDTQRLTFKFPLR